MRAAFILIGAVLVGGCEALMMQGEPGTATTVADAAAEEPMPGCSVKMAPRWSVAPVGMPSFIANFVTKQQETSGVPLIIDKATPTQVVFSFVKDPIKSPEVAVFTAEATQLKSGVCGMVGTFQPHPGSFENGLTMVPLLAERYVQ